jgi:lipoprotein signal peptidase
MKKFNTRTILVGAGVILLDLFSKALIEKLNPGIVFKNSGFIFGLGQIPASWFILIIFGLAIIILGYFFAKTLNHEKIINGLGLGLLLGGAISNLVDRTLDFRIIDFISIWILPTFNLADLSIVAGVILICLGQLTPKKINQDGEEKKPL